MTENNRNRTQQKEAEEPGNRKRPLIGLVPLYDEFKDSYWMLPGYMIALEEAGAIPVMMPLTAEEGAVSQLVEQLDGFVLTGGHDVDPAVYGVRNPLPAERSDGEASASGGFKTGQAGIWHLPGTAVPQWIFGRNSVSGSGNRISCIRNRRRKSGESQNEAAL